MLTVKNLGYWYDQKAHALYQDINMSFQAGRSYAIIGSSGSGKTTFLSLLAGLDSPKEGEIYYQDQSLSQIGLNKYRNQCVSIVFQSGLGKNSASIEKRLTSKKFGVGLFLWLISC